MTKSNLSQVFNLLHPAVQRWVWQQEWSALRDIQETAIKPILQKEADIIISASTAGGKTEAAFLPIFSDAIVSSNSAGAGIHTLAIIPLKALINDQFRRLSFLGETTQVKVTPWHGDVSQSIKNKFLTKAEGILLITPESLESLLINKGSYAANIFSNLSYIVIDELHAFIGTERGKQLQSLMSRVDRYTNEIPSRVGLSATLGDMNMAYKFLRPQMSKKYKLIESNSYRHDLRLIIKGYLEKGCDLVEFEEEAENKPFEQIADYLYNTLRGKTNLVFANSRSRVEELSCFLREKAENEYVPNEFFPHHGSLSKELRQELEVRMLKGNLPTTTVCTNTLELGIDIGSVDSVAQIGLPPSVSSLRQRLGRSGRQVDTASVLRIFCIERDIDSKSSMSDELRLNLFIIIASVELLLQKWYEPPEINNLHLSTLVQQIVALVAQYGGLFPASIWNFLCKNGAFDNLDLNLFQKLLVQLSDKKIIQQDHDGTIVLGSIGEKLVNNYTFYAAFSTANEFNFLHKSKTIASVPLLVPLKNNERIILAGRKWKILNIDIKRKIVSIVPAQGGNAKFIGGRGMVIHDQVAKQIKELYTGNYQPNYLDSQALELFKEGKYFLKNTELIENIFYVSGNRIFIFPWLGTKVCNTLAVELNSFKVKASLGKPSCFIECEISLEELFEVLIIIIQTPPTSAFELAKTIKYKQIQKYDHLLSEELLCHEYALQWFDTEKSFIFWNKLYQQLYLKLDMPK